MQRIASPPLSRPLQKRFLTRADSHIRAPHELASGMAALPSAGTAFAATQGAWRFLNNDRVKLSALAVPLREVGPTRLNDTSAEFGLLVHDWCKFTFQQPTRKQDEIGNLSAERSRSRVQAFWQEWVANGHQRGPRQGPKYEQPDDAEQ